MSLAHFTLPTLAVEPTARFLEQTLGYTRDPAPANSPVETVWLAAGGGQQIHIVHVEGFETSPFEGEFGRHIALFRPAQEIAALQERLRAAGAQVMQPLRPSAHERFFFREPVNGYVFEVIAQA
jgi:predicted enzyme related to lactoylglutathione lyase